MHLRCLQQRVWGARSATDMAQKSLFRGFMAAVSKRWKKEMPSVQPLDDSLNQLPKASTFYAGPMKRSGQHVFLYFQHSPKAWQVGRFTINVVLSADKQNPQMAIGKRSGADFADGYYRIGFLVGKKDKWWHLNQDDPPIISAAWRPLSYDDPETVLSEAVADVTRDVLSIMRLLDVNDTSELKTHSTAATNSPPPES